MDRFRKEDLKMKRVAAVAAASLCFWLCGSVALATCHNGEATVYIEVGPSSFGYANKADEPIPCVLRNKRITIHITWLNGTQKGDWISFSNFAALEYNDDEEKWKKEEDRGAFDLDSKKRVAVVTIEKPMDKAIIRLDTSDSEKGRRLITFTVKLWSSKLGGEVTFDPPWHEKP